MQGVVASSWREAKNSREEEKPASHHNNSNIKPITATAH
jgi:hypothetical protein